MTTTSPAHVDLLLVSMRLGGSTIRAIADATGISKSKVHRMLKGVESLRGKRAKRPPITRLHFELVHAPGGGLVAAIREGVGPCWGDSRG